MLTMIDCGCSEHQSCEVNFNHGQALVVKNLIANLPMLGKDHTYICQYGHTHRVIVSASLHVEFPRVPRRAHSGIVPSS